MTDSYLPKASKTPAARALGLLALMSGLSCGPAPAPERAPTAPLAIGSATPPKPAAPPKPEPGPRAPADLALLVRANDPAALMREIISILPPNAAATASALDPAQLLGLLVGGKLAKVIDPSQPIDVAMVGAEDPSIVVSLAVKPEAEAALGDGFVLREENGLTMLGAPDDGRIDSGQMKACALSPSVGRSPLRLICASDDKALSVTAAYLARTVAGEPFDSDARLTVPGNLLRERKDHTSKAIGNAASAALGEALVERFVEEIDHLDVDLRLPSSRVEIGLDLRLTARESLISKLLVLRSKPAPPPRAFYRLPADSIVALHTTGALPEDIAPLRKVLTENLETSLNGDGYQPEKTRALRERIESLLLTGGPLVVGVGVAGSVDGADKALAAFEAALKTPNEARLETQARTALATWVMFEVQEPAEKWTQGLRDLVARSNDADKTKRAGSTPSTPHDLDSDHIDVRIGTLDASLKLPKDSLHLEVLITPRTKGHHPARKAHIFVVPAKDGTWIGFCDDANAIASRLRVALDDSTEVGTLAKSSDAAALRSRPAVAAGIIATSGLAPLVAKTGTTAQLHDAARDVAKVSALGLRSTDVVSWTMSSDGTTGAVRTSIRAEATRNTAIDILRILGM